MGAIGRAEGEGGARVSLINFRSRYRPARPYAAARVLAGYAWVVHRLCLDYACACIDAATYASASCRDIIPGSAVLPYIPQVLPPS
ncbi:hypothetical protein A1a_00016 [Klebsiella phage VLCpiA1a]|nr:hypothetical protein A1a_00016 [Klebsiella phage VLCpiA1a]